MNRQSLLFLLFSTASAFSPAALPRSQCITSSHPISHCGAVDQSSNNAKQPLVQSPFHSVNTNYGKNGISTASSSTSLPMMKDITAEQRPAYKKRIAALMAFLTGWADCLFIKKFNFFGTMMTGNSMKVGMALVDGRLRDAGFYVSIIASYVFGVGFFRRTELSHKDKAMNAFFAPIVTACFVFSDYWTWLSPNKSRFVPAMLLSFAWGIINSVGSEVTGTLVFVLTGGMTRMTNMVVDRISSTAGHKTIPTDGFLMSSGVLGGFIAGAAWCTYFSKIAPQLNFKWGFGSMGVIYGLLFLWLDQEKLGAWWTDDGELCDIDADGVDCN